MKLLMVSNVKYIREHFDSTCMGFLDTPRRHLAKSLVQDRLYAIDNEIYSLGDRFDFNVYLSFLRRRLGIGKLTWVTVPDCVGNHDKTIHLWHQYSGAMRDMGLPLAFVCQDGIEDLPDFDYRAIFIGGTDKFKYSDTVKRICKDARHRKLWVHVGRVNSIERMFYSHRFLGADSVDGTTYGRNPEKLEPLVNALKLMNIGIAPQQRMF